MMKTLIYICICAISLSGYGQTIVGQWETYDDKTKKKKSIIEIYEKDDFYYGKIIEKFQGKVDDVCKECKGEMKDKPIIGLVIINDMKKEGKVYEDGTITDPESGDVYSCSLKLINQNKLKVRGYLGFSLLGRTQYWIRKKQ